jgi:hypothetical protein
MMAQEYREEKARLHSTTRSRVVAHLFQTNIPPAVSGQERVLGRVAQSGRAAPRADEQMVRKPKMESTHPLLRNSSFLSASFLV